MRKVQFKIDTTGSAIVPYGVYRRRWWGWECVDRTSKLFLAEASKEDFERMAERYLNG